MSFHSECQPRCQFTPSNLQYLAFCASDKILQSDAQCPAALNELTKEMLTLSSKTVGVCIEGYPHLQSYSCGYLCMI